ncbi:MAG TPA: DUF1127 domain-containing protein [Paracoccaceae bacterium]|nr:DUF1127 domain-containing protein [Paracoccaceae bacterium]
MTAFLHATPTLSRPLPPLSRLAFRLAALVLAWEERRATRQALSRLDAHMLTDIGLAPDLARTECAKRFWQD